MSNEELAALVKQGDRNAAAELWEQTHRLIYKLMGKYAPLCALCGVEMEDLRQTGYLAMIRAVNAYDPDRPTLFTSYLGFHVSNAARETLGFAGRGRTKPPPVPRSLSEPLDMAGITLEDTITDPDAAAPFERADEDIYTAQLHDALEECLDRLTEKQSHTLRELYYRGRSKADLARDTGVTRQGVNGIERQALWRMCTGENAARLREYREDIISRSRRHSGFASFAASGYSSVEWAAERLTEASGWD
ncbi:MAG: sigma-70 family RNA polymerase sigma factor [Oscillospiraceae bacterium]|jgi:RNA polymerase sigma factor (sigma-70 family)|nr:sigma-70 family RNA polymerase sigma factor [Oscillospiraceae bacterium]